MILLRTILCFRSQWEKFTPVYWPKWHKKNPALCKAALYNRVVPLPPVHKAWCPLRESRLVNDLLTFLIWKRESWTWVTLKKSWHKPKTCHKIASSKSIKLDFASHSATGYPYIQFLYISSLMLKLPRPNMCWFTDNTVQNKLSVNMYTLLRILNTTLRRIFIAHHRVTCFTSLNITDKTKLVWRVLNGHLSCIFIGKLYGITSTLVI